ncbi:MAG: CBS domain-containing protein [Candidatus Lokiarchaeota archaeon]|nr:CBS domain-containing protein [Candidatus Lokiarchaeota archaeon]
MPKVKKTKKVTKSKTTKKASKEPKAKQTPSKASKKAGKILPVSALDIYDEFATARLDDNIVTISKIMAEKGVENVILVDDANEPLGSVSALDVVKGIASETALSAKVEEIMSNVPIVEEGESISEVFEQMDEFDSEFVAVTKKGKLVGCCTLKDLMIDDWTNKDRSYDLVINEKDGTFDLVVVWQ